MRRHGPKAMSPPAALLAAALSSTALAGGFAVSDQDAAASGRSGTAVGTTGSASAVHFNPAGLAGVDGVAATVGATAILPSLAAVDAAGAQAQAASAVRLPPHVYGAYGFGRFALAAGFNAPFGGGVKWPDGWSGRTDLVEQQLQVLAGHLGGAWRIDDEWSVGAVASVFSASVLVDKRIDFVDVEGRATLGGSGVGVGGQAGVTWAPLDRVRLGFSARLPATVALTGRAHFDGVPASFAPTLPDQAIRSAVTLPAKLALGGDVRTPWARLLLDVEYTFWSSYSSFDVDFAQAGTPDVMQPRNWANAPTFRLGAERGFGATVLRLGGVVDLAASPADTLSPSLPDSTRLGLSAGVGRAFGPVRADLAYQFVAFLPRTATGEAFPARYTASAHIVALSLSYAQPR